MGVDSNVVGSDVGSGVNSDVVGSNVCSWLGFGVLRHDLVDFALRLGLAE